METLREPRKRYYESVLILHPDTSEDETKKFFQRNKKTIEDHDGALNHIDTWGKRKLTAPIRKMKMGTYYHSTFEGNTELVAELERLMKIDDRVLRVAHVRLDERKPINDYVEQFRQTLAEAHKREQEREARRDVRRSGPGMRGGGGPRPHRREEYQDRREESQAPASTQAAPTSESEE